MASVLAVGTVVVSAPAASAAPAQVPPVPQIVGNPNPGTDLFASLLPPLTGGTTRVCATSPRGVTVRCVEHVVTMPSAVATASGVTYAHWIFCKNTCTGSLLVHELVHVRQFEQYGDLFGPLYLAEAAQHGTHCENKYEKPAYQTGGQCL
jgi:hypothetical protein